VLAFDLLPKKIPCARRSVVVKFHSLEDVMKSASLARAVALFLSALAVVGCESTGTATSSQNPGYSGGNGAFGEDPVQPGEHSTQRFNNSTGINNGSVTSPSTQLVR
jgi:hypothetical protein